MNLPKNGRYFQGFFKPSNPKKYKGDPTKIVYRSSWEFKFMMAIDKDPSVLQWQSEELVIGYRDPTTNKVRRYFPDFWVKKIIEGKEEIWLIEIKPESQTKPPVLKESKSRPSKKLLKEVETYAINQAKWEAANSFCKKQGWKFAVITEKHLGLKPNK